MEAVIIDVQHCRIYPFEHISSLAETLTSNSCLLHCHGKINIVAEFEPDYFYFHVYECFVGMCVCVPGVCAVPEETRR